MNVALVIPAKGTSERLPEKNLRKLGDESLVRRACRRALRARRVTTCYLDTESEDAIRECIDLGAEGLRILRRPAGLATNHATGDDLAVWELEQVDECDVLCQTFATAPLLRAGTIDRCLAEFEARPDYDSFLTVLRTQEYFWSCLAGTPRRWNFRADHLPNSQDIAPLYMETHGLYGIRADALRRLGRRTGDKPLLVSIPKREALDINDAADLWQAERMLR